MLHIYTMTSRRADMIELQMRSFKKYLQEDFKFTVFNNAHIDVHRDNREFNKINEVATRSGVKIINVERDVDIFKRCQAQEAGFIFDQNGMYANANVACAYPLCWAWDTHMYKENDNILFLHSDVFLSDPVKLTDFLNDHVFAYIAQGRPNGVKYMWDAFFLADLRRFPDAKTLDWYCGMVNGSAVDVGGQTHHYLVAHPGLPALEMRSNYVSENPRLSFQPPDYEYFWAGDKRVALHYRSASNWNYRSEEYHNRKTEWLIGELGL